MNAPPKTGGQADRIGVQRSHFLAAHVSSTPGIQKKKWNLLELLWSPMDMDRRSFGPTRMKPQKTLNLPHCGLGYGIQRVSPRVTTRAREATHTGGRTRARPLEPHTWPEAGPPRTKLALAAIERTISATSTLRVHEILQITCWKLSPQPHASLLKSKAPPTHPMTLPTNLMA